MPIPSRELHTALSDLGSFINSELAATQIAIGALRTVAHQVSSAAAHISDPEEALIVGADAPEVGWVIPVLGPHGAREFAREVGPDGPMVQRLTRQWIVAVYTAWEDDFRALIARAHGVEKTASSRRSSATFGGSDMTSCITAVSRRRRTRVAAASS